MNVIGHYMQVHLAGAAAGIDLFGLARRRLSDADVAHEVHRIRGELIDERGRLVRMAADCGAGDPLVLSSLARVGAQVALLGPRGNWMRRTPVTDLALLEAMRDAVAGKISGWQALLVVVDEHGALDRSELEVLLRQGEEQHAALTRAHHRVAARALAADRVVA